MFPQKPGRDHPLNPKDAKERQALDSFRKNENNVAKTFSESNQNSF